MEYSKILHFLKSGKIFILGQLLTVHSYKSVLGFASSRKPIELSITGKIN